jgi:hypothetical protein
MVTYEEKIKEIEKQLDKIDWKQENTKRDLAKSILLILWGDVSLTRTQLKYRLTNTLLRVINTNMDEIISLLIRNELIESSQVETEIESLRRKNG